MQRPRAMPPKAPPAAAPAAAAAPEASLVWQLDATGRHADAHRATSARLGVLALLFSAAAVATLERLGAAIAGVARAEGFTGSAATLQVFDKRMGYSAADASATLRAWGPRGVSLYCMAQAVDTAVYIRAYRAAAVVACNAVAASAARRAPALRQRLTGALVRAPLLVAALDRCENAAQVAFTAWHELSGGAAPGTHPRAWAALTGVASALNVAKWSAVAVFATAIAAATLACAVRLGATSKRRV